jgi:hypothetical protein
MVGADVAVDGAVAGELEVEPVREPDCEVDGEVESAGALFPGEDLSVAGWDASPVCDGVAGAVESALALVEATLFGGRKASPPLASARASAASEALLTEAPRTGRVVATPTAKRRVPPCRVSRVSVPWLAPSADRSRVRDARRGGQNPEVLIGACGEGTVMR